MALCLLAALGMLTVSYKRSLAADTELYEHALVLIEQEEYAMALTELKSIESRSFPDEAANIRYCQALIEMQNNKYAYAAISLDLARAHADSDEMREKVALAKDTLAAAKENYEEEQRLRWQKEQEEAQARYQERLRTEAPWVGMLERDIDNTILGRHSFYGTNTFPKNGEIHHRHLYRFTQAGTYIYYVTCIDGTVTEVQDYRSNPIMVPSTTSKANSSRDSGDPYHASDYSYPDDFYDDNYDDFFDLEDAEDYWEAHH